MMVSFKQFLNEFELEGEQITGKPLWNGKDYLDKDGNIDLSNMDLTELPVTFPEEWENDFYCYENRLTSLKGSPKIVKGQFLCYENRLTSLIDGPVEVFNDYNCSYNILKDLQGAPVKVYNWFDVSYNPLQSLKGLPKIIGGSFVIKDSQSKPLMDIDVDDDSIIKQTKIGGSVII